MENKKYQIIFAYSAFIVYIVRYESQQRNILIFGLPGVFKGILYFPNEFRPQIDFSAFGPKSGFFIA
jgi:hypothetical protein